MKFHHIVILTGAGISAESGIPVFRSEDGLWENHRVEDVATYAGFDSNKALVHQFYNGLRQNIKNKEPNSAHLAITKLQEQMDSLGGKVTIITQNIDDLHERANSKHIIHMHGQIDSMLCESCQHRFTFWDNSSPDSLCPHCHKATLRPDIVWFGEIPYYMDEIEQELFKCDLFIAIGTSGVVYPAAGFASICRNRGIPCLEFNLEPSSVHSNFTQAYYGKAGTTLPKFVDYLLKEDNLPETL